MGVRNWGCWGKSSIFSLFPPMSAFPPPSPPPRPCGPFLSSSPSSSSCCQTISALLSLLWAGRSRGGVRVQSPPPPPHPQSCAVGLSAPPGLHCAQICTQWGLLGAAWVPTAHTETPPLISRGIFGLDEDQTHPPPLSLSLDIYFCICIFLYRKL